MLKIKSSLLKRIASFTAVIAILIFVPIMFAIRQGNAKTEQTDLILNVWQIDSFEGGRGSRTAHLQKIATEFSESTGCYLMVTSLSSASARLNLEKATYQIFYPMAPECTGLKSISTANHRTKPGAMDPIAYYQ